MFHCVLQSFVGHGLAGQTVGFEDAVQALDAGGEIDGRTDNGEFTARFGADATTIIGPDVNADTEESAMGFKDGASSLCKAAAVVAAAALRRF